MHKATLPDTTFVIIVLVIQMTYGNLDKSSLQPYDLSKNINTPYHCQDFTVKYKQSNASLCNVLKVEIQVTDEIRSTLQRHSSLETAAKYCSYFKIPFQNCSCDDVVVINNLNGHQMINCRQTFMSTTHKTLTVDDINDLCRHFNISFQNCTCELFNLCEHFNKSKVVRRLYTHDYQIIYAAIATFTAFLGILGNLLVILVSHSRSYRVFSNFNALIKMLAIYDLMFAVFQVVVVFPKFWTGRWLYGEFLCRFFSTAGYLSALLAVSVILAISVERYLKTFHPLYEVTKQKLNMALGLNFIFSLSATIPLFVYSDLKNTFRTCRVGWPRGGKDAELYNLAIFIIYFALPIIIVIVLYGKIIKHLKMKTVSFNGSHQMFKQRGHDNKRVTQSMIAVVVIFVLFVFPKHIVAIYLDSKGWNGEFISSDAMSIDTFFLLIYIANIPYLFHVCTNPLIYSITDSRWRRDLKTLVSKLKNTGVHDNITMTTLTNINEKEPEKTEDDKGFLIVDGMQRK